jgi:hypothetical protein
MTRFAKPVCTGYYEQQTVSPITSPTAGTSTICSSFTLTHSWNWALLEKPLVVQLFKNFPAFYGTHRFITVLARTFHWSLSWARSIRFLSLRSFIQRIRPGLRLLVIFRNKLIFYGEELLAPRPTPPLSAVRDCSYPPYLEAVSSIRNPRTCPAVVSRDPPNMAF